MDAWDFLVDKADPGRTQIAPAGGPDAALEAGEVLVEVERFALTANNITYAAIGDSLGYWKFFPAPEGLGRIPAWGFGRVVRSRNEGLDEGLRLFGYLPMSTHIVMRLAPGPAGFTDAAPHRAALPPTYNNYAPAPETPGDDHRALLQPLVGTAFLLDDALADDEGLEELILSSASSKTALGLAWFAKKRGAWKVTGLTSPANAEALKATGLYDRVLTYDDLSGLAASGPAAYVDFAGRAAVTQAVHEGVGEKLRSSHIVGLTHRDAARGAPPATGPQPAFFFAPERMQQLAARHGMPALAGLLGRALGDFARENTWLSIRTHRGPDALTEIYRDVLAGRTRPANGHIVTPR